MPFPAVKRVLYRRNPLDQVICQLRFPPILRIDAEVPVHFQDATRRLYPDFSETSDLKLEIPKGISDQIPAEVLRQAIQSSATRNYQFASEDGIWKVNLTRNFLALSTTKYERWESFKERLADPLAALIRLYSPSHFSRTGLRYIDIIRRSALGLTDVPWADLLNPSVAGMLAVPEVAPHVQAFEATYEVLLADGDSVVRINTKSVTAKGDREICHMIDSDFYTSKKTPVDQALDRLDFFNARASRLIQWCITERLHSAMEPQLL